MPRKWGELTEGAPGELEARNDSHLSELVTTTLLAGSTWPTLTLYPGLLSSVRRESLHLILSSGRSSYFRMIFLGSG